MAEFLTTTGICEYGDRLGPLLSGGVERQDLGQVCAESRGGGDAEVRVANHANVAAARGGAVTCPTEADPTPVVELVACWERPTEAGNDWTVPILDVEDAIRAACRRLQVREIVCDPYRWERTYQVLEAEGLPVVEFPQSAARMTPATQRFYEAVMNGSIAHTGDPRLAGTWPTASCVWMHAARGCPRTPGTARARSTLPWLRSWP